MRILRLDILDSLSMLAMDINSHNCLLEVWIRRLHNGVVLVVQISKSVETFEYELEQSFQVLWTRGCNEDIAISMSDCCSYSDA